MTNEGKPSPTIEELLSRALLVKNRVVPVDIVDRYPKQEPEDGDSAI